MRKILLILAASALILASCGKVIPTEINNSTEETPFDATSGDKLTFDFHVNHPDASTKVVKTGWEVGDVVFVFFRSLDAPRYLRMTYDGTAWTYTEMNGKTEEALGLKKNSQGTLMAVYLPFGNKANIAMKLREYEAEGENGTPVQKCLKYYYWADENDNQLIFYSYYLSSRSQYEIDGEGNVTATLDMSVPEGYVQFFMEDDLAESNPSVVSELRVPVLQPKGIYYLDDSFRFTWYDKNPNLDAGGWGAPLRGYAYNKEGENPGFLFSGYLDDDCRNKETDYYFTYYRKDTLTGNEKYYKKDILGGKLYTSENTGRAISFNLQNGWTQITDYFPVDMGTDLSLDGPYRRVYWSNKNLGAVSETNSGDYYAWGETETKQHFNFANYKWGDITYTYDTFEDDIDISAYVDLYKYSGEEPASYYINGDALEQLSSMTWTVDGEYLKVGIYPDFGDGDKICALEEEDDAAHAILGGQWRIPNAWLWQQLLDDDNDCQLTVKEDSNGYKINGWEITSKKTGNSIFLPYAGFMSHLTKIESGIITFPDDRPRWNDLEFEKAYYWSSEVGDDNPIYAWAYELNYSGISGDGVYRWLGLPIRPVTYSH